MLHQFEWNEQSNGCCGVIELINFDETSYTSHGGEEFTECCFVGRFTKEALWKQVFKQMMRKRQNNDEQGAYAHIWFVKRRGNRKFEQSELMKLFQASKDVWHLGTYKNPNSGNTIRGFSFVMKQ